MRLNKLILHNFMGSRDFTFEPNGSNANVFGANGTGKTTLMSAFSWLLFGKDAANRKDFAIKTLDADNNALPGLDHEVEGVFEIAGRPVTLRKVFSEKWTKKRGNAKQEFTGHSTEHFINSVPVKEKEYADFVSGIASEETFKILTNPLYFSETLKWEKRRQILLEVCGDVSDEDVIASSKALAGLTAILNGNSLDDHKKIIAAEKKKINEKLQQLPVRIDEATRSLPDVAGLDAKRIIAELGAKRRQLQDKQQELTDITNGGEVARKRKEIAEFDAEVLRLKNEDATKTQDAVSKQRQALNEAMGVISKCDLDIANNKQLIEYANREINRLEDLNVDLRKEWYEVNGRELVFEQESICPTCGQAVPEGQLEETRDSALKAFNLGKAQLLEKINASGKAHSQNIADFRTLISSYEKEIKTVQAELAKTKEQEAKLIAEIKQLQENTSYNPQIDILEGEKNRLEQEIADLQNEDYDNTTLIKNYIEVLADNITMLEEQQQQIKLSQQTQIRIVELKTQEKTLAAEFERLEGELYLCECFTKAKVALLEGRINSRFESARFKMFDQQINGGIAECCDVLFNGVPFSSGLNTGARTKVGLDIIKTLCDYYHFWPPIFVDNRESIDEIPEMRNQVINLFKRIEDKNLRVETSKNELREAM